MIKSLFAKNFWMIDEIIFSNIQQVLINFQIKKIFEDHNELRLYQKKMIALMKSDIEPIRILVLKNFYEMSLVFDESNIKGIFIEYYDDFFNQFILASQQDKDFKGY